MSESQVDVDGPHLARRAAALFVDSVVVTAVGGLLGGAVGVTVPSELAITSGSAVVVVAYFVYFVLLEATRATTPGKSLFGLRVVCLDGTTPDLRASVVRNVLRAVDWLPAFYLLGVLLLYVTDDTQRLGDLAAVTVVVRRGG
jgi:uncharacterized RDD family membrane protein YckC